MPHVYSTRVVGHLYVRCSRMASQTHSCFRGSGKLPSSFVRRGHEDRKGKRDNTQCLEAKRERYCVVSGERKQCLDHNGPKSLIFFFRPRRAIEGFEGK